MLRFRLPRRAIASAALAAALAGCHATVTIDDDSGKRLADLDMTGPPPHGLALMGADRIEITHGDKLAIHVDGDATDADHLRFTLKDGTLGILRDHGWLSGHGNPVTVRVTMPAPRELSMGGSGSIHADSLDGDHAQISIAGSGSIETPVVATRALAVNIAGSGAYRAAGSAATLDLNLLGSGNATMDALKAEKASVSVAGSGAGGFASDGTVSASIVGSGTVRVHGRAACTVSAVGSGKLVCDTPATASPAAESDKDDKDN